MNLLLPFIKKYLIITIPSAVVFGFFSLFALSDSSIERNYVLSSITFTMLLSTPFIFSFIAWKKWTGNYGLAMALLSAILGLFSAFFLMLPFGAVLEGIMEIVMHGIMAVLSVTG